jgi:PAS domain-containing protein
MKQETQESGALQKTLIHSERSYRSLINLVSEGVFLLVRGRFRFVNAAFVKMIEAPSEYHLLGKEFLWFVPAEGVQNVTKRLDLATSSESSMTLPERICDYSRSKTLKMELTFTLLDYGGQPCIQVIARL